MKYKRIVSIVLILALLLGCMGLSPVSAEEDQAASRDFSTQQVTDAEAKKSADKDPGEELMRQCEDSGLFRFLDKDTFRRADHTYRLPEEEELNTYVFQNRDGTKSVYYLEQNVKYIAPNGEIRDKDITLVPKENGYGMRENDVDLLLPNRAGDGITMSHGRNRVQLVPQDGAGEAEQKDNSIVYADFYGEGTALKYSPTLSGVKEDIILNAYTGVNSFAFVLYTGGLDLFEAEGQYYLAKDEKAEAAFYLGQIIVYDAVGCPSLGNMQVETLAEGEAYRLTVSADVDFLTAPTTVYPVTIDPTITVTDSAEGGVIEDASVFAGYPNTNFGNYIFNTIGYTDANYGIGRTVVRLNGLLENETFAALDADYIERVEFYMKDGGSSSGVVDIYPLLRISTWTESSITWSNTPLAASTKSTSATMGGGAWTAFDITSLAKQWKSGAQNGQCGFIMIGAEEETKKIGALSCEYTNSAYWPYVVVTYSVALALDYYSKDVNEGQSFTLTAMTGSSGGTVTWTSGNSSIASVSATGCVTGHLAGETSITVTHTDPNGESVTKSCTVYVTIPDGLYYIKNASSGLCLQATTDQAYIYEQKTDQTTRLDQLWLITYTSANRRYLIQPIQDLNLAMIANGSGYVAVDEAASNAHWEITHNSFGYAIQYAGDSNQTSQPVVSGMPGSQVYLGTWGSNLSCHWEFESTDGIFLRDDDTHKLCNTTNPYTIEIEHTFTLDDLGITMETYGSGFGGVSWTPDDYEVATINPDGDVTTIGRGKINISISASANDITYSQYYTIIVYETVFITNLYDSTIEDDEEIIDNISTAVAFLNTVYSDALYLCFEEDGYPLQYANAPVDICPNKENGPCDKDQCEDNCKNHHKNLDHIGSELLSYKENMKNRVVVLWSNCGGSIYCRSDENGKNCYWQNHYASVPARSPGNSSTNMPVIQFLTINKNRTEDSVDLQDIEFMAVILAHEIAHTLFLGEVSNDYYKDYKDHDKKTESEYCIMNGASEKYADIYIGSVGDRPVDILCEYCTEKLMIVAQRNAYEVES